MVLVSKHSVNINDNLWWILRKKKKTALKEQGGKYSLEVKEWLMRKWHLHEDPGIVWAKVQGCEERHVKKMWGQGSLHVWSWLQSRTRKGTRKQMKGWVIQEMRKEQQQWNQEGLPCRIQVQNFNLETMGIWVCARVAWPRVAWARARSNRLRVCIENLLEDRAVVQALEN